MEGFVEVEAEVSEDDPQLLPPIWVLKLPDIDYGDDDHDDDEYDDHDIEQYNDDDDDDGINRYDDDKKRDLRR